MLDRRGHQRVELRRLLTEGRAVRCGLVRLDGSEALFERSILLAAGLWEALHGLDAFPAGLDRVPTRPAPDGLAGWLSDPAVARAARVLRDGTPVTLMVRAADEAVALGRCAALAEAAGARLLAARLGPGDAAAIQLLGAHAAVRDATPVLVIRPADGAGALELATGSLPGPLLVVAPAGAALRFPPDRPVLSVPAGPLCLADRRLAWQAALPELSEADVAVLAARHPLDPALIEPVAIDARAGRTPADPVSIAALIRARAVAALPPGVEVVTPSVPWSRLVLADGAGFQLRDAVARLEYQALVLDDWQVRQHARASRGVRLLLTGLPGTGKSLAAEAVASAAGTDLLRVDVSQIVSKWIGETEKNLAAAFDVAERTQAVLLLDEADALFGTRTEISDAHDRYANLETAYLLQRLDRFDGPGGARHQPAAQHRPGVRAPDGLRRRLPAARRAAPARAVAAAPAAGAGRPRRGPGRAGPAVPDRRRLDPQRGDRGGLLRRGSRRADLPVPPRRRGAARVPESGAAVPGRTCEETR